MKAIDQIYINGEFVSPHGTATFDLISPSSNKRIGSVTLGDETDTQNAIASAKAALKNFSNTSKAERIAYLQAMHDAVLKRRDELIAVMVQEYGAPLQFATMSTDHAISAFPSAIETLKNFDFVRTVGHSKVRLEPLGVVGMITPWNASNGFICSKLATAISAGCTAVIKPSEMSAMQTQLITECLHEAGLPKGVFNIVNGLGEVVGAEITRHKDIAKISFTGSTLVGKTIARAAVDTMKRVTLELGGKSPNILLDDADFEQAIPIAIAAAYMNSGQACIAGTRLLVPEDRLEEVKNLVKSTVAAVKVGAPENEDTNIGPMVSIKQYNRVQDYIKLGMAEGAELLIGGPGKPEGLEAGNFVKPTVFIQVKNNMRIAREEIFGPVLSIITYKTEEEAIEIANDTDYGLQAYVSSSNLERASTVAAQIAAGRVLINQLSHDPLAPFGGFKQSGIGREFGSYGLETYLEPKTILV
ncbi:aldehyde dehydrogenase family protein [Pedobacter sp. MC2016-24]|uniref:aldehyde dehydrogenase family protein n=1 Tax=Pedobacter sp. MC2016-24 TaxID=2780090 RepID=UPI00187E92BF|nr:aldehyde dehydrogenase family protein [Pedobacter sp. MC2016-24]MBE9601408.1 aldehyde dehydrogenase family protein [Pedobacter sp. MC2016-24]